MSAHTQGKWVVRCGPPLFRPGSINVLSGAGDYICEVGDIEAANADADARLIAASPDLLAFAQSIADNLVLSGSEIGDQARAVIARATGARP